MSTPALDSYDHPGFRKAAAAYIEALGCKGPVHLMVEEYILKPCAKGFEKSQYDEDDSEYDDSDSEDGREYDLLEAEIDRLKMELMRNVYVTRCLNMIVIICVDEEIFSPSDRKYLAEYLRNAPWWSREENSGFAIDYLTK
jgi:hypothetical protein